jgi:hypothetical protein
VAGAGGVIEGGFVDPGLPGAFVFPEGIVTVLGVGIGMSPDGLGSGIDVVAGPGVGPATEDGVGTADGPSATLMSGIGDDD